MKDVQEKPPQPTVVLFLNQPLRLPVWPIILLVALLLAILTLSVLPIDRWMAYMAVQHPHSLLSLPEDDKARAGEKLIRKEELHAEVIFVGTSFVREAFDESFFKQYHGKILDLATSTQTLRETYAILSECDEIAQKKILLFLSPYAFLQHPEFDNRLFDGTFLIIPKAPVHDGEKTPWDNVARKLTANLNRLSILKTALGRLLHHKLYKQPIPEYQRHLAERGNRFAAGMEEVADEREQQIESWESSVPEQEAWLEKIAQLVQQRGGQLMLVNNPLNPQYEDLIYGKIKQSYRHTLSQFVYKNTQVKLYDLSDCGSSCRSEYFWDLNHMNATGRAYWADFFTRWMSDNAIFSGVSK